MNKKVTTLVGVALGASLAAGFGIYKYFSNKRENSVGNGVAAGGGGRHTGNLISDYIGNGLTKNTSLYGTGSADNDLVGGGLYKA